MYVVTAIVSATSSRVAPARIAAFTWKPMQSLHCLAMPIARQISSFSFTLSAPSAIAAFERPAKLTAASGWALRKPARLRLASAM